MARNKLTPDAARAREHERLFESLSIRPERLAEAERILSVMLAHRSVYQAIMQQTTVPWQVIGIIHSLETSQRFNRHLHNGDPLTAKTVKVPRGRPRNGNPPFTFQESAVDALTMKNWHTLTSWTLAETLHRLELYNGTGYRSRRIFTPYLWSFSTHYTKGKFVADGVFDPEAVSGQCGGAVLLKLMVERGIISFEALPEKVSVDINGQAAPTVTAYVHKGNSFIAPRPLDPLLPTMRVVSVAVNPLIITIGRDEGDGEVTRAFPGQFYGSTGMVDASDLIREFLGGELRLEGAPGARVLRITT